MEMAVKDGSATLAQLLYVASRWNGTDRPLVRGGTSLMNRSGYSCPSGSVRRRAMEEILRAERYQATAYAP